MNLRLKTNIDVETKLSEIQNALQLSSKAAVMRIAIAYSLRMTGDPREEEGEIKKYDIKKQNGADYNRFTIFGSDEVVYKAMMQEHYNAIIEDDLFFPEMTNAHISRGIKELYADYKMSKNKEALVKKILS